MNTIVITGGSRGIGASATLHGTVATPSKGVSHA